MLKGRGLFGVILAAAVAAAGCGSGSVEVTVSTACDEVVCPANQVCEPITGLCIGSGLDTDGNSMAALCDDVTCTTGEVCDPSTGSCVALADCSATCESEGATCGTICGVSCGMCAAGQSCIGNSCVDADTDVTDPGTCTPNCAAANACGDDGCGGSCGTCGDGFNCSAGVCVDCCAGKECGTVNCGSGSVLCGSNNGDCPAGEECTTDNQCRIPGLPNGSFCGITADCQPSIPDPTDPTQTIDNPAYPTCMSEQCDSNFCLYDFAPGELVFINACSVKCNITKDDVNNHTGLAGADGVEDDDAPFTDCNGFVDGPAGTEWKCVSSDLPGTVATALCAPGTTFRECSSTADCPTGETCQVTQLGADVMTQRCMTAIKGGDWGVAAAPNEVCNEDPFAGDPAYCEGGLCLSSGYCRDFCDNDDHCNPNAAGSCVDGTCANWAGRACTADTDCYANECTEPFYLFGTSLPWQTRMCFGVGCEDVNGCPDNYYCRYYWNGEPTEELGAWAHQCLPEVAGGAALGEECDSDPSDNIPGATCAAQDLCIGGRCSAVCSEDSDCATDAPANQRCIVEEAPFDGDDDGFYDYILGLKYCRSFEGYTTDCLSEVTCGEGQYCSLYEVENWIEDSDNPGEMIANPDGATTLKGACIDNDADGAEPGQFGDLCGLSGMAPCESYCMGADEAAGTAGYCSMLCESHVDCPGFSDSDGTEYQGRCDTGWNLRYGYGLTLGKFDDDLFISLCQPSLPSSEADCSADGKCDAEGEACVAYQIAFGPDYDAKTEYLCEDIISNGDGTTDPLPTLGIGDECDPEATSIQCGGLYCMPDVITANADDQKYYCSSICNPEADTCAADGKPGMACLTSESVPRKGMYADNAATTSMCLKDKECMDCLLTSDCPGDRVCINFGADNEDNALFACVDPCTTAADCGDGTACNEGTDYALDTFQGCFDKAGATPVNKCLQ